ncbi:GntR family transcriptional regulator [Atopobacter sp. AH10]|uniref:GntR family transcriptional regulator n=1 Tax=Atopobacter sp. AH10 TaxID=2315861 RepID=UPI000EF28730|nr:GntR family transcriptional regulator [Atopobacter sp. AH10]RLK62488.1 GntR family transcriptional regulator [Atopobacter sp. AH10]
MELTDEFFVELIDSKDYLSNLPLKEIVYKGLRRAIILGRIPVGQRINEKEYAKRLNISRTPIRYALELLQHEGLVENIPKYGTIVKKITLKDAEEIYEIRRALEKLAFTNALMKMTREDIQELDKLMEETQELINEHHLEQINDYFARFNEKVLAIADMPRLTDTIKRLKEYLTRFRDISVSDDKRRLRAFRDHLHIYQALKNKDILTMCTLLDKHLLDSKEFILNRLSSLEQEHTGHAE